MSDLTAQLASYWTDRASLIAGHALVALVALAVTLLAARLTLSAVQRALGRTSAHANARLLVSRLVQFGFLLAAASWVLAIFGVQLTALVALLGAGALAVSLALQDVLRNLVAGLYILVERPFTIGEQIDFKTFSGTVETIELRTTALRTAAGQRVVIPNAMLFADALVNRSAYGQQLLRLRVTVPATDEARAAVAAVQDAAASALGVPDSQAPSAGRAGAAGVFPAQALAAGQQCAVFVEGVSPEKLVLRIEAWTADARAAAPGVAWSVRERLPDADIAVLE